MSSKTIVQKMHIKSGQRFLLLDAPASYTALMGDLPDGVVLQTTLSGQADVIQCFVTTMTQLKETLPVLQAALKPGGYLWIAYPKLTSKLAGDLSRDIIWDYVMPLGTKPVAMVAIDEDWSAFGMKPT